MAFGAGLASGPSVRTALSPSMLREQATLLRTVTGATDGTFTITTPEGAVPFACVLLAPKAFSAPAIDQAPRQAKNTLELAYLADTLGVPQLQFQAGARFSIGGVAYELVSESRAMRNGLFVWSYKANILPVSVIWPLTAVLKNLDGSTVAGGESVPLAVWESYTDRITNRGRYDEVSGDIPPEFLTLARGSNRALVVGTRKYKIKAAHPQFDQPHVSLALTSLDA